MTDPTPLPKRSEGEVLARELVVQVGGVEKILPVRSIADAREWKRELAGAFAGKVGAMNLDSLGDGSEVLSAAGDEILRLVVDYDTTASLGGREWLEANATEGEVYLVFRRLLAISFPFVNDLRTALVELRAIGLADLLASGRSLPARPTSESAETSDSDRLVASSKS